MLSGLFMVGMAWREVKDKRLLRKIAKEKLENGDEEEEEEGEEEGN